MKSGLVMQLLQLALFSIPLTISPGPNNLMVTTNCAQFGYRKTLPSLAGISLGVVALFMMVALGLGGMLARYPQLHWLLKIVGSAYILYLSYKLYTSNAVCSEGQTVEQPITFGQAALLQMLNPKIWFLAVTASSTFLPFSDNVYHDAIFLSLTLGMIFFPCNSIWAMLGLMMRRCLSGGRFGKMFNRTMGLITASSIVFVLL